MTSSDSETSMKVQKSLLYDSGDDAKAIIQSMSSSMFGGRKMQITNQFFVRDGLPVRVNNSECVVFGK